MLKILFIISSAISLFSQTINFKETKYIDALDNEIKKTGYIHFGKDFIETSYINDEEVLLFKDEFLYIKKANESIEIDLNRDMAKKIYFTILEAIYLDDLTNLELYFEIKKENKKITLTPKSVVASYLKSIEFKKDKKLEFLIIYMLNNDRIRIEQTN